MPGLSFQGQGNSRGAGDGLRRPGAWVVPLALVILSIALITLCVRSGSGGVFAAVRTGVHTVTKPIESVCSVVGTPFRAAGDDSEQVSALEQENEQLKTLVAELEEYRQQNQRLTALVQLSDTYKLSTKSASVIGTQSGWDRVSTIDKGSNDGLRVGMGVISSCGLYGQIETVTPSTSTVRLVTSGGSSVAAMIQGSRARGVLSGSYDGELTLEYISVEYTVGEDDYVITSGDGGVYPKGIVIGRVNSVDPDPSNLYYRIHVDPIFNPSSCQEVLVLTGDEGEVGTILDEDALQSVKDAMLKASSDDVVASPSATDALQASGDAAASSQGQGDGSGNNDGTSSTSSTSSGEGDS